MTQLYFCSRCHTAVGSTVTMRGCRCGFSGNGVYRPGANTAHAHQVARALARYPGMREPVETPEEATAKRETMFRAGGDCVCGVCYHSYWKHPADEVYVWLHVLCDGSRVKL